jgi:phage repressor protein C with HTH and peptisase S24 domain
MKSIERFFQYIEYKGIKPTRFEKDFKLSNGYLGTQLKRKGDLGETILNQIIDNCLDLNPDWLLTGKGTMLRGVEEQKEEQKGAIQVQEEAKRIPFFDIEAEGGTRHIVDMSPSTTAHEMIDAGDWFRDASAAMRVHGDSMYPKYPSGSIVVFKEVLDRELIVYGQDYVIETSEYRLIKRVQTSSETHKIKAISYNNDKDTDGNLIHEPLLIPYTKITRLFRILGKVERNESSRIVYNGTV